MHPRIGYSCRMKHIVVSHTAALALLARIPDPRYGDNAAPGSDPFVLSDADIPTDSEAAEIIETMHLEIQRLDVLTTDPQARRHSKHLTTHLCTKPLPAESFISIDYWRKDVTLYVACPELAFLQALSIGDDLDAIYAGYMLTSDYRIDRLEPSGVVNRQDAWCDGRLTTKAKISAYLDLYPSKRSARDARYLLRYVHEASRSPRESALAMFFSLPQSRGGQNAGSVVLNPRLSIRDGDKVLERYPDILLTAHAQRESKCLGNKTGDITKAALDYDSDAEHRQSDRIDHDAQRRNELEMLHGIAHFTITKTQANSFKRLVDLAKSIKRKLRIRNGIRLPSNLSEHERAIKSREILEQQYSLWERFIETPQRW